MRLLFSLTDVRVLLGLGVALLIFLAFGGAWLSTVGRDVARSQAELAAMTPEERMNAEFYKMGRLVEEFAPPGTLPSTPGVGGIDPELLRDEIAALNQEIDSLERNSTLRGPAPRPVEPSRLSRSDDPPLLSTAGMLALSCSVGFVILLAGGGISFLMYRSGGDAVASEPAPPR